MVYENFYPGSSYSLDSEYGDLFAGYRIPAAAIGLTTDPRTGNQLQEVSNKTNPGGKIIEVSTISPQIFESIPEQHLKEINRLTKLTGTKISVHGPAIEPSGYNQQGKWSEADRKQAENQIASSVERSHKIDPEGNITVTFHPSYLLPEEQVVMKEKGEFRPKAMLAADTRTGDIIQIKETEKYFPEKGGLKKEFNPEEELKKRNEETWVQTLNNLNYYSARGEEYVEHALKMPEASLKEAGLSQEEISEFKKKEQQFMRAYAKGDFEKLPEEFRPYLSSMSRELDHANIFLRDSYNMLRELYNRVYKEATQEDKEKLNSFSSKYKQEIEAGIEKNPEKMKKFADMIEEGVKVFSRIKSPHLFQPLNNFLIEKNSETFSNVALNAYKKFGNNAPIVSIENPPAGTALSKGQEIKELIEKSREKLRDKLMKEKSLSKSEAEKAAEKLIGATWDVGHINMLRKYGYDKGDIVKETEKIAPFIKHVHLSDNFGYEHTELPMGMGNVPIKEMMKKLGKKGEEVKKIIEAAQWYQFFKNPPLSETYEALGSPLFPMKAPYWNQIQSTYGNYFAFPSAYLPEQHFSLYGTGFSNLPTELGGQIPGKQSRFSGTPTA